MIALRRMSIAADAATRFVPSGECAPHAIAAQKGDRFAGHPFIHQSVVAFCAPRSGVYLPVGLKTPLAAIIAAAGLFFSAPVSRAETNPMRASFGAGIWDIAFSRDIVSIARRDLGKSARQLGLPSSLWCADAANRWRRKAGLRPVPSRRAIDQAKGGKRISHPVVGALLITGRGRRGHHVDLIVAVHGDGTVTTVGGNVSGRVAERRRVARGIIVLPA